MPDVAIRPYASDDEPTVLALLGASLGKPIDSRYRAFFRWKHLENSFGPSHMWVAIAGGEVVGFRAFLRWRFVGPAGERVDAVRAVDTATHPNHQGRGIFRSLTLHAMDELRAAGVSFVFNTPNAQSRPGYLKMGWTTVGRVPVQVRPLGPGAVARMARARTPADLWSRPSTEGAVVGDRVHEMLSPAGSSAGWRTDRTLDHLRWRYDRFAPVAGRAIELADGFAILRLRQRGPAVEATVDEVVVSNWQAVRPRPLLDAAARAGADYLLAGAVPRLRTFIRTSRLGPVLTWRALDGRAEPPSLELSLGDVELF